MGSMQAQWFCYGHLRSVKLFTVGKAPNKYIEEADSGPSFCFEKGGWGGGE